MHFPSEGDATETKRRQIIKDGWIDYEGEVVKTEDIQLEQNRPGETVAPSQIWREDSHSHTRRRGAAGTTDFAIQRIPGRLRKWRVPFRGLKITERLAKR